MLPLLPPNQILPAFQKLTETAKTDSTRQLITYIDNNWMKNNVWSIDSWSMYREQVRTNYDVEGTVNQFNLAAIKVSVLKAVNIIRH